MTEMETPQGRRRLVQRYLNAETTLEEEQALLAYYKNPDATFAPGEEPVRLLITAAEGLAGEADLSMEKVEAFDRLMADTVNEEPRANIASSHRKTLGRVLCGIAAASVAALLFVALMRHLEPATERKQVADNSPKTDYNNSQNAETVLPPTDATLNRQQTDTKKKVAECKPHKKIKRRVKQPTRTTAHPAPEQQILEIVEAATDLDEPVETYRMQPVGDATIVTKTLKDGSASSCLIITTNDEQGYQVIPINQSPQQRTIHF